MTGWIMAGLNMGGVSDRKLAALDALRELEDVQTIYEWSLPLTDEWFGNAEATVKIKCAIGKSLTQEMILAVMQLLEITMKSVDAHKKGQS